MGRDATRNGGGAAVPMGYIFRSSRMLRMGKRWSMRRGIDLSAAYRISLFHSPNLKFDRMGRQLRCANCVDDPSSDRDGSSARRANKLDLTQRLDLSDPDNVPGSAGGAANDASMCGHRPTRREGGIRSPPSQIKASDVFCGPGSARRWAEAGRSTSNSRARFKSEAFEARS